MPTREELETELGKAWKAMAKKEGHSPGVPKQFVPSRSDSDALADTLLRLMRDGLAARYGSGVRPSYVSSDLAILDDRIERYEAKIKALEVQNVRLA